MGAETLEGGDMINGPPTALGEAQTPPRPAAAHPHPIPSYSIPIPALAPSHPPSKRHHSPGLITHTQKKGKRNNLQNRRVHSRQARHDQPHQKYDFGQIPALGAGRFLQHRAFHILPFNDDGWTMTSLRNVNSSQIRKPETHPPGIPWRGIHNLLYGQVPKMRKCPFPIGEEHSEKYSWRRRFQVSSNCSTEFWANFKSVFAAVTEDWCASKVQIFSFYGRLEYLEMNSTMWCFVFFYW